MFLSYLIVFVVFVVYTTLIFLVKKGFIFFLGVFGLIFIFYIINVNILWFNGSKRSKNIQKELIDEK